MNTLKRRKTSLFGLLVSGFIALTFTIVIGSLVLGGLRSAMGLAGAGQWSDGGRTGVVTKFSYTGTLKKSWEGELHDGTTKTLHDKKGGYAGVAENTFLFSVPDDPAYKDVTTALTKARRSGKRIDIQYTKVRIVGFSTETPYYITAVNFIDDEGNIKETVSKK